MAMKVADLFGNQADEINVKVNRYTDETAAEWDAVLNEEHQLKLYDGEKLLRTFVCSPSHLGELCAGWLFCEGFSAETVEISADGETAAAVNPAKREKSNDAAENVSVSTHEMLELFSEASHQYARSHGVHECIIKGKDWHIIRTDIGRHNAIDKAVGAALAEGYDLRGATMFSSGRINEQTVTKAANCGMGCLMSKAVITRQALLLAEELGLKVLFSVKNDSYMTV